jgi:hypothetical protein
MIYRLLGELEISRGGALVDLPGGPTLVVLALCWLTRTSECPRPS